MHCSMWAAAQTASSSSSHCSVSFASSPQKPMRPHTPRPTNSSGNGAASVWPPQSLSDLLQQVAIGGLSPEDASQRIKGLGVFGGGASERAVDDYANLDVDRVDRTGFGDVVCGDGKTPVQIANIMKRMSENEAVVLATRVRAEIAAEVAQLMPGVQYNDLGHTLILKSSDPHKRKQPKLPGLVAIVSGGTSDGPIVEEVKQIAEVMGCYCFKLADMGLEGLHRVMQNLTAIRAADVVIVVSGWDGALPSVIAGLIDAPVIAVPTSTGYGSFNGVTPLLTALNAGSPGVAVVNIDNGFGAAMIAARILKKANKFREATMQ